MFVADFSSEGRHSRGRVKERGPVRDRGLFTKSNDKNVCDGFPILCRFNIQFYESATYI